MRRKKHFPLQNESSARAVLQNLMDGERKNERLKVHLHKRFKKSDSEVRCVLFFNFRYYKDTLVGQVYESSA